MDAAGTRLVLPDLVHALEPQTSRIAILCSLRHGLELLEASEPTVITSKENYVLNCTNKGQLCGIIAAPIATNSGGKRERFNHKQKRSRS